MNFSQKKKKRKNRLHTNRKAPLKQRKSAKTNEV